MQRFVPALYKPSVNVNIRGLLYAWAGEDDALVQAVQDAKEQIYVLTAQLRFLDALGANVGVFRPTVFNLTDTLFRRLIPALSFYPKQVIPTIKTVLDIFYEENNPKVKVHEINENQIEIQIPSSIPALRRGLRGAQHFHSYSGTIVSVDNVLKEIVIDLEDDTKVLKVDEVQDGLLGTPDAGDIILSNTAGTTGVTLQFGAASDLSAFVPTARFMMTNPRYPGSYIPDPSATFTLTKNRGRLGQVITSGDLVPNLTMQDASNIPDAPGRLCFNFGKPTEESLVRYLGRPNNTTLLLDPAYMFINDHAVGEWVNMVVVPYQKPNKNGTDYSVYLVGIEAARLLAQQIVESLVASGVVVNWTIIGPQISC